MRRVGVDPQHTVVFFVMDVNGTVLRIFLASIAAHGVIFGF